MIRQEVIIAEAGFDKKLDSWFPFKYQIHVKTQILKVTKKEIPKAHDANIM